MIKVNTIVKAELVPGCSGSGTRTQLRGEAGTGNFIAKHNRKCIQLITVHNERFKKKYERSQ